MSRATGVARRTIGVGITELRQIEDGWTPPWGPARLRKPGAGRKKTTAKDPTLLPDLQALVEATTRGDAESPLLWTARSQRNLVAALVAQGQQTSMKMVARLLKELGYSLQANRKRLEGAQHPAYPHATSLVITADGGGSNGYRLRLWKLELQGLVDELGFPVTVCHLPPGTSKWKGQCSWPGRRTYQSRRRWPFGWWPP